MRALICCLLVLSTAACGASGPSRTTVPRPSATPLATTAVSPVAVATPALTTRAPIPTGLVFAQVQYPTPGMWVIDVHSNSAPRTLPAGVPAPDWSILYTATYDGAHTQIAALDPLTGAVLRATSLAHAYQTQWDEGYGTADAGGVSPNGRWLALTGSHEYHADGPVLSRFAVLDTAFAQPAQLLVLTGNYTFDALANDGQTLFLIENLPPDQTTPPADTTPRYRVVFIDLRHPTNAPQVLVDKTTQGATMAGTRQSTVVIPDGQWLFSLYRNPKQPFIHALNLTNRFAVCIFLPAASGDPAAQGRWALARTSDATRLYAANSATNTVVEIDAMSLSTLRTVHLALAAPQAANPLAALVAGFAPHRVAAKGDRLATGIAVTPDGGTLVLSGGQGLTLVDAHTLQVRTHVLTDQYIGSVAISADGQRLYAANGDMGLLVVLDLVSGATHGTIPLGQNSWEIVVLRVT